MFELGGHAVVLNSKEMQISRGETPEDTARVLSGFCQAIAARVYSHETLERFSTASNIPVINALSDPLSSVPSTRGFSHHEANQEKTEGSRYRLDR